MNIGRGKLIAIIGAQGTGKSTLIHKVHDSALEKIPYEGRINIQEVARHCPYPIGAKSGTKAQTWIFRTQFILEDIARSLDMVALLDRCLIDQYAYYRYWNGANAEAEHIIESMVPFYNCIFFLTPNPRFLIDDGVRPTSPAHQLEIDNLVAENVAKFCQGIPIFRVPSSDTTLNQLHQSIAECGSSIAPSTFYSRSAYEFGASIIPPFTDADISEAVCKLLTIESSDLNQVASKVSNAPGDIRRWLINMKSNQE